ncbi:MAG TPA: transketolase, partial [Flavobacteriales bacterium]|nr:transketolase [Flavobacteriales bacterium]
MAKETEIDEIDELQLKEEIVNDYKIACLSREMSLLGRREVLTGKAKFGIFGDGKEIAQIALAKQFQNGDFRSGYYRDQTFMMAAGLLKPQEFFAQLYAHADVDAEPASAGRQMNGHYATRSLNPDGTWRNLMEQKNSSADISPTASQMPRLLGLAYASKFYRNNPELKDHTNFSNKGNEIAFGTIGDASTSEGLFWESINAAGVLGVPMVISVWDDGHGISVSKKYQTTKESISEILQGFEKIDERGGYKIIRAKGWDYGQLVLAYEEAAEIARTTHTPVLVHVEEMTQPQGHSTSGSHERYKSAERLAWETEFDPITKFGEWMIDKGFASQEDLNGFQEAAKKEVRTQKAEAWKAFMLSMKAELSEMLEMLEALAAEHSKSDDIRAIAKDLSSEMDPMRKEIVSAARRSLRLVRSEESSAKNTLLNWLTASKAANEERYSSHLHSESELSALNVNAVAPVLDEEKLVDGREVIRDNFDALLAKHPELIIFGEDSGKIGGVNQGLEGLQEKYGEHRVFDTGIREATIIGQGIGMAMRGLRPVAEIQYLDYLLYALQV